MYYKKINKKQRKPTKNTKKKENTKKKIAQDVNSNINMKYNMFKTSYVRISKLPLKALPISVLVVTYN